MSLVSYSRSLQRYIINATKKTFGFLFLERAQKWNNCFRKAPAGSADSAKTAARSALFIDMTTLRPTPHITFGAQTKNYFNYGRN
jgi:hypothetical protein